MAVPRAPALNFPPHALALASRPGTQQGTSRLPCLRLDTPARTRPRCHPLDLEDLRGAIVRCCRGSWPARRSAPARASATCSAAFGLAQAVQRAEHHPLTRQARRRDPFDHQRRAQAHKARMLVGSRIRQRSEGVPARRTAAQSGGAAPPRRRHEPLPPRGSQAPLVAHAAAPPADEAAG